MGRRQFSRDLEAVVEGAEATGLAKKVAYLAPLI
jgi:hypothetical protein